MKNTVEGLPWSEEEGALLQISDEDLIRRVSDHRELTQDLVDEYYRRCIPFYLDTIGVHWHTGYYLHNENEACSADQERMVQCIAASINIRVNERVLDVGCGIGATSCWLAREYSCTVYGLTPIPEQQAIAKQVLQHNKHRNKVHIELGHASDLPYPDNFFDVVVFFESPCHFPDRQRFFHEAYRVLKPGGRIAGEDWLARRTLGFDHALPETLRAICRSWFIPMLSTGDEYVRQMGQAGFSQCFYIDMRSEMALEKGFAVSADQRRSLQEDLCRCSNHLMKHTIEGLLHLGAAFNEGTFTIGRFVALRASS